MKNKEINKLLFVIAHQNNTKLIKFFPTQRELKGLEAQVIRSKHNLSTYIHVGKALIEENGHSLVKIKNAYGVIRDKSYYLRLSINN